MTSLFATLPSAENSRWERRASQVSGRDHQGCVGDEGEKSDGRLAGHQGGICPQRTPTHRPQRNTTQRNAAQRNVVGGKVCLCANLVGTRAQSTIDSRGLWSDLIGLVVTVHRGHRIQTVHIRKVFEDEYSTVYTSAAGESFVFCSILFLLHLATGTPLRAPCQYLGIIPLYLPLSLTHSLISLLGLLLPSFHAATTLRGPRQSRGHT